MTSTTLPASMASAEPCGARPPGPGRHLPPCVLPAEHEGEHRDAFAATWEAVATGIDTGACAEARQPVRMCVRCCAITAAPVVVSEVHQSSGPGFNVYACPECASYYPPVPDVLDLFNDRDRRRGGGG